MSYSDEKNISNLCTEFGRPTILQPNAAHILLLTVECITDGGS